MDSIDVNANIDKYWTERAKRMVVENFDKRLQVSADPSLGDLLRDPWADYDALAKQEPPLKDGSRTKFLIIGAGHNGLINAYHLVEAGFSPKDIVIVDLAGGWGGTWYWNRYPGLQCDVEGFCYLPLLEQSGFVPKDRYSHGEEIRRNAEHIVAKFGLQGMFCTRLIGSHWNEQEGRWEVKLRRELGPDYKELNLEFTVSAQFLIVCSGPIFNVSIPALPGFEDFKKNRKVFHSARWDYEYTGGSSTDPRLVNLKDKVVGVVGTAASSIQVVGEVAKWAKHLYVFQRTPTYVGPHYDEETTPELWEQVTGGGKPGWQAERIENLDVFFSDDIEAESVKNMVNDERSRFTPLSGSWGSRRAVDLKPEDADKHMKWMLHREAPHTAKIREHIKKVVENPETAEKLTPHYPGWCKRPAFHNSYLQAFNLPNVTLVDTDGQGVREYSRKGVKVGEGAAAREYELDLLVLATGFEISGIKASPTKGGDAWCRGRDGRELNDKWNASDCGTLFGIATNGFPNLSVPSPVNGGANANLTSVYLAQAQTIAHIVATGTARSHDPDRTVVEVTVEAENAWVDKIISLSTWYKPLLTICPPTYFTGYARDIPDEKEMALKLRKLYYAGGPVGFAHTLRDWRNNGNLDGIAVN